MTLFSRLIKEHGLFSGYSDHSIDQSTYASSPDSAHRYNKHKLEWINFSEKTINQLIKLMKKSDISFEELYRFSAKERCAIAEKLGHDSEVNDASAFGQFRDAQDGMLADSFETLFNKECEQPWPNQKTQVFKAVIDLIKNKNGASKNNLVIKEAVIGPQAYTEELIFDGGIEYVIDTRLRINKQAFDLLRIVLLHNPLNNSQDIMQIFYVDLEVLPLSKIFQLANRIYCSMMEYVMTDCKADRHIFLNKIGLLMHFMTVCLPVLRGNSAICEWIMRAAAFTKGIEVGEFNHDTDLPWDFKALVTPNPAIYADWFSKEAIFDMVANSGPERPQTFTM